MPKECEGCGEKKALRDEFWWKDNRYPDGWAKKCKKCSKKQSMKLLKSRTKEVHCVVCNRLFPCTPDTAKRYRLTCKHGCQRTLVSNIMYVKSGKRPHAWNFFPDGTPVPSVAHLQKHIPTEVKTEVPTLAVGFDPRSDFASSYNPF